MGLERFEVRFFFSRKITKTDLALELVIKNLSKVIWRLSVMFLRMWLKNFFFVKSSMGTPLDWKFFTLKKKSHFHLLLGQTRAQNKSCSKLDIRYLRRMCFSFWSILTQIKKSYWFRSLHLIGVFVRRPEKSGFKSAEISAASSMDVGRYF